MFKCLSKCNLLALAILSASANAGTTQSNLIISKLTPEGSGVLISFTVQPSDCATSYKGAHAYLNSSVKDFDIIYLTASTAQATKQPITIYYADNGDCSSLVQLLSLSNVVIN